MKFEIGQRVRYKPGCGTYGYEDVLGADGRLAGVVRTHMPSGRIRVELTIDRSRIGGRISVDTRCVEPKSLIPAESSR